MSDTSLLPEILNIPDHKQGDTFAGSRFTVTENNVARDLTGASITMTFLPLNRRSSAQQTLTLGSGLTLVTPASGIFDMDEQDIFWDAGEYYYECQIIYADGLVKTPFEGTWKIVIDKVNNS